jgi:hypothetical protein
LRAQREEQGPAEDLDCEDERPTVVVLNEGDLTAEEAATEEQRLQREAEEAPADLSSRIVFKAPTKRKGGEATKKPSEKKPKKVERKAPLSFDDEEDC